MTEQLVFDSDAKISCYQCSLGSHRGPAGVFQGCIKNVVPTRLKNVFIILEAFFWAAAGQCDCDPV